MSPGKGVCGWVELTWTQQEGLGGGVLGAIWSPGTPSKPLPLAFRMYRVYGKKNIKLEPVPLKGASLDPR